MDLLIATNTVAQEQADKAPASGTPGWATDGNPATGQLATDAPAWHYNMMMSELLAIIKVAGITPSNSDWSQVLKGMQTIFSPAQYGVAPYSAKLAQLVGGYQLETGAYYPLWGTTDAQDRNALALIMASLGTVYLGVLLSQSDMNQIEATNGACVLEADNGAYGDTTPGSAGGHCLLGWSYSGLSDSDTVDLLTWGAIQKVTWGWLRSRIMEAHGLVWPQLTLANGLYPTGPDIDALKAQNVEFLTA